MVKCDICKEKIAKTFLNKLLGTTINSEGKTKYVCSDCQKEHKDTDLKTLVE
jgi:hypothetical protein